MKKIFGLVSLLLATFCIVVSCGEAKLPNGVDVVVAASPVPHAEIMKEVKKLMRDRGYNLYIKEFSDYVTPNLAVDQDEVDANFFQHVPYLDDFNAERGTHVVSVGAVHYEPFGLYAGSKKNLEEISDGDKIAVPNDVTNEARALLLLESAGLIRLRNGASLKATVADIVENSYNLQIVELESAQIPRALDSVAFACMNGNYALQAKYKVSDALFIEPKDSDAAIKYANVVCVKSGRENEPFVNDLMECLKSEEVKNFVEKKYDKSVILVD